MAPRITPGFVRRRVARMTPLQIFELLDRESELRRKMADAGGPMRYSIGRMRSMLDLLRAWRAGTYRQVSWTTVAYAGFGLLYFLMPFDLVADFIPGVGLVDDAVVVSIVLAKIGEELDRFERWRDARNEREIIEGNPTSVRVEPT